MKSFELYLSPLDAERFKTIVTESPVGEGETETALPFFEGGINRLRTLLKLLETTAGFAAQNFPEVGELPWMIHSGILNPDHSAFHPDFLVRVGQALYQALFPSGSKVEKALQAALRLVENQNNQQLHVQLKFEADSVQRSRLADYPWELLHDGKIFLTHHQVTISRYIAHDTVPPNLPRVEQVNVLLVSSAAFDLEQGLKQLTEQEQQAVREGLKRASSVRDISLAKLKYATLNALRAYLTEHRGQDAPHVLHFHGHGLFGKQCNNPHCRTINPGIKKERCRVCNMALPDPQGYLVFEDDSGEPDYISARKLGALLQQSSLGDGSNQPSGVSLVVLSACQSAMAVAGDSVFNGTAQNLISHRIPAVVAMQYSVSVLAATQFAEQFYRSLGQKNSLAVAVSQGREAMGVEGNQWYRPVLYLRWRDNEGGQLFVAPTSATRLINVDIDTLVQDVREKVRPYIEEHCGAMQVLDMPQYIKLNDIYTSVDILERITGLGGLDIPEPLRISGLKAVEEHPKLMILGKPGAGKTTFLKHLALQCINREFQENLIPFFITLERFAEMCNQLKLSEFIVEKLDDNTITNSQVIQLLKSGKFLLLLDGLDAVQEKDSRIVINYIQEFSKQYRAN